MLSPSIGHAQNRRTTHSPNRPWGLSQTSLESWNSEATGTKCQFPKGSLVYYRFKKKSKKVIKGQKIVGWYAGHPQEMCHPKAFLPQRLRLPLLTSLSFKQSKEVNPRGCAAICSPHLLLKRISASWSPLLCHHRATHTPLLAPAPGHAPSVSSVSHTQEEGLRHNRILQKMIQPSLQFQEVTNPMNSRSCSRLRLLHSGSDSNCSDPQKPK